MTSSVIYLVLLLAIGAERLIELAVSNNHIVVSTRLDWSTPRSVITKKYRPSGEKLASSDPLYASLMNVAFSIESRTVIERAAWPCVAVGDREEKIASVNNSINPVLTRLVEY